MPDSPGRTRTVENVEERKDEAFDRFVDENEREIRDVTEANIVPGGGRFDVDSGQLELEEDYRSERDRDRPHEATVGKDEHGRVTELNAEYLDQQLEKYLTTSLDTEQEMQEKKYGKGWLGRTRRWLDEDGWGKALKVTAKISLGVLCATTLAGSGGALAMAAPLLYAFGGRQVVDGILEAAQFGFERGTLGKLRESRTKRAEQVLRAMEIRNAYQNDDDRSHHVSEQLAGRSQALNLELEDVITSLDQIESEIISRESNLAKVRVGGKLIRAIAGIATTGWAAEHMLTGLQNFDADKVKHVVELTKKGLQFQRLQTEITDGVKALGMAIPMWALVGSGAALTALTVNEFKQAKDQSEIAENPKKEAIFTVRGRSQLGNTQHELSNLAPETQGEEEVEDKALKITETKNNFASKPGSIWEWTRMEGLRTLITEKIVIVGYDNEGNLRYRKIDNAGNVGGEIFKYDKGNSDEPYSKAKLIADSVDAFKSKIEEEKSVDRAVKDALSRRHFPKEMLAAGKFWQTDGRVKIDLPVNGLDEQKTFTAQKGDRIKIEHFGEGNKTARVTVFDKDGNEKKRNLIIMVESLIDNSGPVTEEKKSADEKNENRNNFNRIKDELSTLATGPSLDTKQFWHIGDKAYLITEIDIDGGFVMACVADVPADSDVNTKELEKGNEKAVSFIDLIAVIGSASKIEFSGRQKQNQQKDNTGGSSKGRRGP